MTNGNCKVIRILSAACLLAALALASGCASPARPELDQFSEEPVARPLNGEYIAAFHTHWFGPVYARLTAAPTSTGFKANSQPGVAWTLVGGLEQMLGQLLAPFIFPNGMLLVWDSTFPDPATGKPGEGSIGPGTIEAWRLPTRMDSVDGPVTIRYRDGRALAVMTLGRVGAVSMPTTDYAALTDSLQTSVQAHYFDPESVASPEMLAFFDDVRGALPKVQDDLTYLASLALSWRKRADIALPLPYRRPIDLSERLLGAAENTITPLALTFNDDTGLATFEGVVFQDAANVDAAMAEVLSRSPKGVIIDLRNCTGMDLSALRVLSWLVDQPVDAGVLVGGAARQTLTPDQPDQAARLAASPINTPADLGAVDDLLNTAGLAPLTVTPAAQTYRGPVTVLTSSRTRSTGEMLASLLQSTGRARIVGERTAGRPRVSREHELGQDFLVRIDEFEWRAPGAKTPGLRRGLTPDISTTRQRAPARAAALITESLKDSPQ